VPKFEKAVRRDRRERAVEDEGALRLREEAEEGMMECWKTRRQ
jgi:hypothetical protein